MNNIRRERFKTILLTVLFILSVALTQQLWITIPVIQKNAVSKQIESMNMQNIEPPKKLVDILNPQSFTINFGGGLHTVVYDDAYGIWEDTLQLMEDYYFYGDTKVEEISSDQWLEVNNTKSITMKFGVPMPIIILSSKTDNKETELYQKITKLDSLLISLMDDFSVYIADKTEGKYYRIKGKGIEKHLFHIMDTIEKGGYDVYYAMKDIYGVENNTLMPISLNDNFREIEVVQEIEPSNNMKIESFAGTFFGENFDFVRKIVETSGSVIYMYGYGQKALKIDSTGILEYVEELDPQKSGSPSEFLDSMKMAVQFVSDHGGWPNKRAYLREVNVIEKDKKKGYQFLFGYRMDGLPVYYNKKTVGSPIEVQVIGKQITYYRRFVKREEMGTNFLQNKENNTILSPSQVLDKNFDLIMTNYLENRVIDQDNRDKNKILSEILSSIQSVSMGYYNQSDKDMNRFIPIWLISFDHRTYYFNAYNGKIIN